MTKTSFDTLYKTVISSVLNDKSLKKCRVSSNKDNLVWYDKEYKLYIYKDATSRTSHESAKKFLKKMIFNMQKELEMQFEVVVPEHFKEDWVEIGNKKIHVEIHDCDETVYRLMYDGCEVEIVTQVSVVHYVEVSITAKVESEERVKHPIEVMMEKICSIEQSDEDEEDE